MLVKCNACKGQKKVLCLGFIEGDCSSCEGTGFVTVKDAIEQLEPKKRGRKAKDDLSVSFVKLDDSQTSSHINEPSSSSA